MVEPCAKTIDSRPGGMGDAVVALWIAEGARVLGDTIPFVNSVHSDVVRAFGHEITSRPSQDCMGLGIGTNTFEDEWHTILMDRTPRTLRWQRTLGWDYEPHRPSLGTLAPEAQLWAHTIGTTEPFVVIAPQANVNSRTAPLQKWLRVAWALQSVGVRTVAIDGCRSVVEQFPFYAHGFGWQHVLALLQRASVVAGNDSGIAHLATTIGVPTVVAIGATDPTVVFGHCLDEVTVVGATEIECFGCLFKRERGFQAACDSGCEALGMIPWQRLRDAILEALETRRRTPMAEEMAV